MREISRSHPGPVPSSVRRGDSDPAIYGFNPDTGNLPSWQAMQRLRNGNAFPGVVRDDSQVFAAASTLGLTVRTFGVILPEPEFQAFEREFAVERNKSRYSYS